MDFVTIDNDVAGVEYIKASEEDSPWGGATIQDSLVVGHTKLRDVGSYSFIAKTSDQSTCTKYGIHLPYSSRLTISNVTLINFDEPTCTAFGTCAHCKPNDGGAFVRVQKLNLVNATNLVSFPFQHASVLVDIDGSLTGYSGGSVLPAMGTLLDPNICRPRPEMSLGEMPGVVCKRGRFAAVKWNAVTPTYIKGKNAFFTNRHGGRDVVNYREKAKSVKKGYTGILPLNSDIVDGPITLSFDLSDQLTNISYMMSVFDLEDGDYVYLRHQFKHQPDFFTTTSSKHNRTTGLPDPLVDGHGSWTYGNDDDSETGSSKNMTYLISGRGNNVAQPLDKLINYRVYRCFYDGCQIPTRAPLPDINANGTSRRLWSVASDWNTTAGMQSSGNESSKSTIPRDGDDVTIQSYWWMMVDVANIVVNRLYVDGILEFNGTMNHHLKANIILVRGRLIAGWPNKPVLHSVTISLVGDHDSPDLPIANGPNVGSKSIGVFGALQLYGHIPNTTWSRLSTTLFEGEARIKLVDKVDWKVSDEIVISTSDYEPRHAEKFTIKSIMQYPEDNKEKKGSVIYLNRSANYMHSAYTFSLPPKETPSNTSSWEMSAKVALITRNIRIEGLDDPAGSLTKQSFGCRVLVGSYSENGALYKGNAQLSGVHFSHCGQLGWTEPHDPR